MYKDVIMNDFENVYDEIRNKYEDKYKCPKDLIKPKLLVYIFFSWAVISTIQIIISRISDEENYIYNFFKYLSIILIMILVFAVIYKMNKNMDYWKKAFDFKSVVGKELWKKVNSNIIYNPDREEINREVVKSELENIYANSDIVDIEDELFYEDISMYTIRFNDENKKRITGTFVILNNCKKDVQNIEEFLEKLNLDINNLIINVKKIESKVYIFIDFKEIFLFNGENFLDKNVLFGNYDRFNQLVKIKDSLTEENI